MPAVTNGSKYKTLIMQKYRCCRFNRKLVSFSNLERILNSDPVYERNKTWTSLETKLSSEGNFCVIIYQHLLLGKTKLRAVFHIASPPATTDITTWLELNGKSVLDTVFVFSIDLSNFD